MSKSQQNQRKNKEKNNKNKNRKKSKILSKILIALIIVLTILVARFIYKTQRNGGGLQGMLSTLVGHDEETLKDLKPIQVLLMGISTDNGGKLTDTIIIATYDPKNQNASLLSIPRDSFVGKNPATGSGYDKINAIYQKKGAEGTLEKVNELTGLEIEYYMVIDNQALIELVDVIGGVEFYVPIDMDYDDTSQDLHIHLKEGQQILDGDKAEQLLRFRKNNNFTTYPKEYGGDDYGRMRTQREFMMATAKQTIKAKNILKIKDIIDIVYEYVETNISISTIKDYVPYAINVDVNAIRSEVLPGSSFGPPTYPLWFFIIDKNKTLELIDELYGDEEEIGTDLIDEKNEVEGENEINIDTDTSIESIDEDKKVEISEKEAVKVKIELINGTDSNKILTNVKRILEKEGYSVTVKNVATTTSKTTIINKTNVDVKFTDNIKELLKVGYISTSSVSSNDVDITVIIGQDYSEN